MDTSINNNIARPGIRASIHELTTARASDLTFEFFRVDRTWWISRPRGITPQDLQDYTHSALPDEYTSAALAMENWDLVNRG
jgi:hypothetical protein